MGELDYLNYIKKYSNISKVLAVVVIAITSITLTGWVLGNELLKSIIPGTVEMHPLVAVVLFFISLAILFYKEEEAPIISKILMLVSVVSSFAIGIFALLSYIFNFNFSINISGFEGLNVLVQTLTSIDDKFALAKAICFIVVGIYLVFISLRLNIRTANILALVIAIISYMGILIYIFSTLYSSLSSNLYESISISTTLSFFLIAFALLFALPGEGYVTLIIEDTTTGKALRRLIPPTIIIPPFLAVVGIVGFVRGSFEVNTGLGYFLALNSAIILILLYFVGLILNKEEKVRQSNEGIIMTKTYQLERNKIVLERNIKELEDTKTAILNILEDLEGEKNKVQKLADDLVKYELAIKNASDHIIITDAEGTIIFANPAVEKITGFSIDEIMGKKAGAKELWGGLMPKKFYEDFWSQIKIKKQPFTGELTNKKKNGQIYTARASVSPVLDSKGEVVYFIGIERDITEDKKHNEVISRLAAIVRDTEDAIISKDLVGNVTSWNEAAEKLYGYTEKQMIGESLRIIYPEEKMKEFDMINNEIKKGHQIISLRTQRKRKDGTLVDVSVTASPIKDGDGNIVGSSTISRDITKEMQVDKAKTEFVSLASHQLRTPLSAINWYTQMLRDGDAGKLNKDQLEFIDEIANGSRRMVDLVNSLLNVSRIDVGTFAIEPVPTDLIEISKSVVKEMAVTVDAKKLKIVEKYDELKKIPLDPNLIRIVIQNLLSNAIKYSDAKKQIDLSIEKNTKSFVIKVKDEGFGIPKEQQGKIFQKLFRADNVRQKDVEGTGLGLYIVKAIVEEAGGKIWFESKINKGTTFYVEIPLKGMKKKEGTKDLTA